MLRAATSSLIRQALALPVFSDGYFPIFPLLPRLVPQKHNQQSLHRHSPIPSKLHRCFTYPFPGYPFRHHSTLTRHALDFFDWIADLLSW